jgi:hypothetical protein
MGVGDSGPLPGWPSNSVPGRAVWRAGVGACARARYTGRAVPGPMYNGPCRAWAGPNSRAFRRAAVLRAVWPFITAQLHELLQVGGRVFIGLATEWASQYHRNEASFDLEVSVRGVDLGAKQREQSTHEESSLDWPWKLM